MPEWVVADRRPQGHHGGQRVRRRSPVCLFRRRSDPHCFVPDHALAPVKESVFVPYIFSREEILALVNARHATRRSQQMWGAMLRASRCVLYCTGMRLGEATTAYGRRRSAPGCLDGSTSKGRSRILAIRDDLAAELRQYISAPREGTGGKRCRRSNDAVHPSRWIGAHPARSVGCTARSAAGSGPQATARALGARPYEFRHAFAVHRLTAWAVEGADVHAKLPWLSAYLGHQNVLGTEVYLKATPQLLQLASQRFEQHSRGKRRMR